MVQMTYRNLDLSDLRGETQADFLIAIEADFEIRDGAQVIFEEPAFPVVELARSLRLWAAHDEHHDFRFDSMSHDEPGLVTVTRHGRGWVLSSVFAPDVASSEVEWADLAGCIDAFVDQVSADLRYQGLDADRILHE